MNGITELAKLLKERENESGYSPVFGTVLSLPDIKIRLSEKIILTKDHLKTVCNLLEQNEHGVYVNMNKTVLLLPYANNQKFIVTGVVL